MPQHGWMAAPSARMQVNAVAKASASLELPSLAGASLVVIAVSSGAAPAAWGRHGRHRQPALSWALAGTVAVAAVIGSWSAPPGRAHQPAAAERSVHGPHRDRRRVHAHAQPVHPRVTSNRYPMGYHWHWLNAEEMAHADRRGGRGPRA